MINTRRTGNIPLILDFNIDLNSISDFLISYFNDNNQSILVKQWHKEDTIIKQNIAVIPLTQQETSKFPLGIGHLEVKCFNEYNFVIFAVSYPIKVKGGCDMTLLKTDGYEGLDSYENLSFSEFPQFLKNKVIKVNFTQEDYFSSNISSSIIEKKNIQKDIENIYSILNGFGNKNTDVAETIKEYIDSKIAQIGTDSSCNCDLINYATKTELQNSQTQNLQNINNTKAEILNTINNNYASKEYVDAAIDEIEISGGGQCSCDIENMVTKDYLNEKLSEIPTSEIAIKEKIDEYCEDKHIATTEYVDDNINAALYEYDRDREENKVLNLILNGGDADLTTHYDDNDVINVIFNSGNS